GSGSRPLIASGDEPAAVHRALAAALDRALDELGDIKRGAHFQPPMIVLRTPKGWTGPAVVDGLPVEGTWRSHQVPLADTRNNDEHRRQLEEWMRSYRPEELFDDAGTLCPELRAFAPGGDRRLNANPHPHSGLLLRELTLPDFRDYAVAVESPARTSSEATRVLGRFMADIVRATPDNFRVFGPDETESNRLGDLFSVTDRQWEA